MQERIIQKNEAGQRLDKYLKKLLSGASSGFIYKMLRKKNITLNEKKADGSEKLNQNDKVKLYLSDETYRKFTVSLKKEKFTESLPKINPGRLPFQILYEDEDILAIDKPSGMLSQKADPEDVSANEYIIAYLLESGKIKKDDLATFRPSVCNRLDRNTSGILIAGKTLRGLQEMSEKLRTRLVRKYYLCIVEGQMTEPSYIKGFLRKDEKANRVYVSEWPMTKDDKKIETEYRPLQNNRDTTLLEVQLITGRTHQIRAQLSSAGHPIVGDYKYGAKRQDGITSLYLHAYRIVFEDGREITAPAPGKFYL